MRKHAEQMRPKFEAVLEVLNTELGGLGTVHGTHQEAVTSFHLMQWKAARRKSLQSVRKLV